MQGFLLLAGLVPAALALSEADCKKYCLFHSKACVDAIKAGMPGDVTVNSFQCHGENAKCMEICSQPRFEPKDITISVEDLLDTINGPKKNRTSTRPAILSASAIVAKPTIDPEIFTVPAFTENVPGPTELPELPESAKCQHVYSKCMEALRPRSTSIDDEKCRKKQEECQKNADPPHKPPHALFGNGTTSIGGVAKPTSKPVLGMGGPDKFSHFLNATSSVHPSIKPVIPLTAGTVPVSTPQTKPHDYGRPRENHVSVPPAMPSGFQYDECKTKFGAWTDAARNNPVDRRAEVLKKCEKDKKPMTEPVLGMGGPDKFTQFSNGTSSTLVHAGKPKPSSTSALRETSTPKANLQEWHVVEAGEFGNTPCIEGCVEGGVRCLNMTGTTRDTCDKAMKTCVDLCIRDEASATTPPATNVPPKPTKPVETDELKLTAFTKPIVTQKQPTTTSMPLASPKPSPSEKPVVDAAFCKCYCEEMEFKDCKSQLNGATPEYREKFCGDRIPQCLKDCASKPKDYEQYLPPRYPDCAKPKSDNLTAPASIKSNDIPHKPAVRHEFCEEELKECKGSPEECKRWLEPCDKQCDKDLEIANNKSKHDTGSPGFKDKEPRSLLRGVHSEKRVDPVWKAQCDKSLDGCMSGQPMQNNQRFVICNACWEVCMEKGPDACSVCKMSDPNIKNCPPGSDD